MLPDSMIRYVSIRQLAVIDTLDLELGPGLTVFTGETGAGKSILVEAVGLLLGERAPSDLVRTGAATATVQAIIETPDGRETILRREVSAQGRSRAFIDDALVTSGALRQLVGDLIDLHGQHEHQSLLNPAAQREALDRFAHLDAERLAVRDAYDAWRSRRDALDAIRLDDRERAARVDLLSYQLSEIDKVDPQPGEDETLAVTRQVLANADRLQRLANESYDILYERDAAVMPSLAQMWKRLDELAALDPQFRPYLDARDGIAAQLDDLAFFLRSYATSFEASPERLQDVETRLAALDRLKRRHGPALADVLKARNEMRTGLAALETSTERAAELQSELEEAAAQYRDAAGRLSAARHEAAPRLATGLCATLAELAMERTRCEFRFSSSEPVPERWTPVGIDDVELYVSPNPGEDLRPLNRIVSGGELSRLMLGMKTLASPDVPGKTLIFDEVDAGIGGKVADRVGARLRRLANDVQVLCITHLPQVAAYARTHVSVSKAVINGRTIATATALSDGARVNELARMMGGDATPEVLEGARSMIAARSTAIPAAKTKQRRK
jgi:DNA repair protein RecN (Recombination protein N)